MPIAAKVSFMLASTLRRAMPLRTTRRWLSSKPYALMVTVWVKPDRRPEFLEVLERDAAGTRAEPDCLRFDLLEDETDPNKFFFYSVYNSPEGLDHHRTTEHYKAWSEFRSSGGIEKQEASKAFAIDYTDSP